MSSTTGKVFDVKVFKRLMNFAKVYKVQFLIASLSAIILAGLAVVRPILLKVVVDDYFPRKDQSGLLNIVLIMSAVLIAEVLGRFVFIYVANKLGYSIIKDIRMKLYKHMLHFKMAYFAAKATRTH